jgi:hypothetical protein
LHNVHSKILFSRKIFLVVWPHFYDARRCDAIRTSYNGELCLLPKSIQRLWNHLPLYQGHNIRARSLF